MRCVRGQNLGHVRMKKGGMRWAQTYDASSSVFVKYTVGDVDVIVGSLVVTCVVSNSVTYPTSIVVLMEKSSAAQ